MDLLFGYYMYEKFTKNEKTDKKTLLNSLLKVLSLIISTVFINYLVGSQWTYQTLHNDTFILKLFWSLFPTFYPLTYGLLYWFPFKQHDYNVLVMKCVESAIQ